MKRLVLSAAVAGLVACGSAMTTASSGDSPINSKQWLIIVGATAVAIGKDLQAGLMRPPTRDTSELE